MQTTLSILKKVFFSLVLSLFIFKSSDEMIRGCPVNTHCLLSIAFFFWFLESLVVYLIFCLFNNSISLHSWMKIIFPDCAHSSLWLPLVFILKIHIVSCSLINTTKDALNTDGTAASTWNYGKCTMISALRSQRFNLLSALLKCPWATRSQHQGIVNWNNSQQKWAPTSVYAGTV